MSWSSIPAAVPGAVVVDLCRDALQVHTWLHGRQTGSWDGSIEGDEMTFLWLLRVLHGVGVVLPCRLWIIHLQYWELNSSPWLRMFYSWSFQGKTKHRGLWWYWNSFACERLGFQLWVSNFHALADIFVPEGELHAKLAVCAFTCMQSAAGCVNLMYMPLYPRITACMKMKMGGKGYVV